MFAELLAEPGVEEIVELRSPFGFMAFHGGALERGTDDIAARAAEQAAASLYAVVQPEGFRWHLPSVAFDPADSPALQAFVDHVDVALAVHGFGRPDMFTTVLLGGRNRELARHVRVHLRRALPHYHVIDDIDQVPRELRGLHPENPVNRPRSGGVQLELPPRVRGLGPFWTGARHVERGERAPHTEALIHALVAAARTWDG
jgi:phage replication-related protein YjqB (UPF0714/DUF867 family)